MKLKSTFTLFFFAISSILFAQSSIYAVFSSPNGTNFNCGSREIIGKIYFSSRLPNQNTPQIKYGEDNKFYLEIAAENSKNYTKILAQKTDIGGSGNVYFRLPDSLKVGKTYLFRMSSTNPIISTLPNSIQFGIGLLPYDIDFKQELSFYKDSPMTALRYNIRLKNSDKSSDIYFGNILDYKFKISDGTKYDIYPHRLPFKSEISVIPKDSINIYKIEEVINSCGVKGDILGEARVVRKDFVDGIQIKNESYTCFGKQFTIDVTSKSINSTSNLKVEFSKDETFKTIVSSVAAKLNTKNQLIIDLTKILNANNTYYVRIISEQPNLVSNASFLFTIPTTQIVTPSIDRFDDKQLTIHLGQQNTNDLSWSYFMQLNELVINGVDIAKSDGFASAVLTVPMPKNDSTLVFSKISNSCGNLIINKPELVIKPSDYIFINFKSKTSNLCEGSTIDFPFDISSNATISDLLIDFNFMVNLEFLTPNQPLTGNNYGYYIDLNAPYLVDTERKVISVTIPKKFSEFFGNFPSNRKIIVKDIYMSPFIRSKTQNQSVRYNFISPKIKLSPQLSLISPIIDSKEVAFVDIPVKFIGGDYIKYTLSNGQKGVIDHKELICRNCQSLNGGEQNIKVFTDKTTTFKITSVENECGTGIFSGETTVNLISENPNLIFDETKVPTSVCRGSTLEIPFREYGKWSTVPQFRGFMKVTDNNGYSKISQFDISKSPFTTKASSDNLDSQIEVWVEAIGTTVKTQVKKITLESRPDGLNFHSGNGVSDFKNKIENIYIAQNRQFLSYTVSGSGGGLGFLINSQTIKNNYISVGSTQYESRLEFEKDTIITFQSASNSCGTTEVNRQIKLSKVATTISGFDQTSKYFVPESDCSGSKRVISYGYEGTIPKKDSLIVQLAKYNNETKIDISTLKFFDVPTIQGKNELTLTIPDTCFGNYAYRIRSVPFLYISSFNKGFRNLLQKPKVKISAQNDKSEVIGLSGANLYLSSNIDKSSFFNIVLNDGTIHNSYGFGVSFYNIYDKDNFLEKTVIKSEGKYFSPNQTTTYSVKSVYNKCGYGTAEGTAKIIVQPTIVNKISNSDFTNTFCSGDSLSLDFNYWGEFPKDTLMGVYLHNKAIGNYNQELATFKNTPNQLNLKLPTDINSGYYYIQTRKRSRSKVYFTENQKIDSLAIVNAKLNLDADKIHLNIGTIPNVSLSGNTEIFAGNDTELTTKLLNQNGQDISKDTLSFINGMSYFYNLSNGKTYNAISKNIVVSPPKTETFSIVSAKNACGVGTGIGSATVIVLPNFEKRIETLGYLRQFGTSYSKIYYDLYNTFCAGKKDSLDIKVYGIDSNTDFSKYKVLLSNKDGLNYLPIKTIKVALITDSPQFKIIRLWHEIPNNVVSGNNYRIKGVSDDESILSTPITYPVELEELSSASLTGNVLFLPNEKVNATVKLTGKAPWLLSVLDKDNKIVFNTLPTKQDSLDNFKNFKANWAFTNEVKLELSPEKANIYKVGQVLNYCGLGKVTQGEFSVDLILSNEPSSQSLVQIYPNPTTDNLVINISNLSEATIIELFDVNGRSLNKQVISKNEVQQNQHWDFKRFNAGVYLLKINSGKFLQTYRVVKH